MANWATQCSCWGGKKKPMFPSNEFTYECLFDASDAKPYAEREIWACVEPTGRNQALNSSTGDVFKWKTLRTLMVERFEMEVPEFRDARNSLVELMPRKEALWVEIVK